MKQYRNKMIALFIATVWMTVMSVSVFAAGAVTYNGDAKRFIFEPGSDYSPTDLFSDFKNIMPGDRITQKIHIENDVKNNVKIKLYIKSLGAHEDSVDFLSKLKLSVTQYGTSNLFHAPANETAQLTEWVYLGTFYSGAAIDLDVTLQVPSELDNRYQNAVGYLDWQFKVEEFPVEPEDPKPPKTGESLQLYLYAAICATCIAGFLLLLAKKKRKQEK